MSNDTITLDNGMEVPMRGDAWDYIGFDGDGGHHVRVVGGRALYEAVIYYDNTPGDHVKLARLVPDNGFLKQVSRYVDPDTQLELVR